MNYFAAVVLLLATTLGTTTHSLAGENLKPLDKPITSGFDHVGLTVKDLAASTGFFTEVLGWRKAGSDPDYPANFVSDRKMFVTLWAVQDRANQTDFNRKSNVGLHHLAITVDSFELLDELHRRAKAYPGVVIEFAPELSYGGPAKHMMLREPSGNRLEFKHSPKR
ncbi:VOC family protein [Porticoccus sp. W117]|uniref:VOC family protein n=1 Tax=Porticoccus sp. W117 TaxID=3054777 RepID=UPI002595DC1B|nr:VOC family protein [Porticoccus sp. W117]MDM3871894.1 VOC family protein [Porticoccus sp. W117]